METESVVPEPQYSSDEDIIRELKISNSSKSSGGMSRFKPIAKDYAEQIEILKDPNTNLYTTGSIEDFIAQFRDRFDKVIRNTTSKSGSKECHSD